MGTEPTATQPRDSTRRYTAAQKEQALRLVRELRREMGRKHGTVLKVAAELGYGRETVRAWVREADRDDAADDGPKAGQRIAELERELEVLKLQNAILRQAVHSGGASAGYDRFATEHASPNMAAGADRAASSQSGLLVRAG